MHVTKNEKCGFLSFLGFLCFVYYLHWAALIFISKSMNDLINIQKTVLSCFDTQINDTDCLFLYILLDFHATQLVFIDFRSLGLEVFIVCILYLLQQIEWKRCVFLGLAGRPGLDQSIIGRVWVWNPPCRPAGWLAGWWLVLVAGWLASWLAGWLAAGWLAGCLAGWPAAQPRPHGGPITK